MKIHFLVAHSEGSLPNIKISYTEAANLTEANRATKGAIDKKIYTHLRALENNAEFVADVFAIRKKFNIPEIGYSTKEWEELKKVQRDDENSLKWRFDINKACKELSRQYKIPFLLHGSLMYIIIGNFIYLPLTKLSLETPHELLPMYEGPDIKICIMGQVSKQQVYKFIRKNWQTIENEMKVFGDEKPTYISPRDSEIISLRENKKMTFVEIANFLAEKNSDYEINEDQVKKAYHRAKDKIIALKR